MLSESINGFSSKEGNTNSGLRRIHLAKPFKQLYLFKMASDYPVIGGLQGCLLDVKKSIEDIKICQ